MDPAHDPHASSAPFPTIPAAATHRQRVARPRRQGAPFRSDHPLTSSSSGRRLGGDDASFDAGPGARPSTAGGSRPSAFVFGADVTTSNRAAQEDPASPGSWGSPRGASFVFGSGAPGPSEMKRSSSLGSSAAPLCGLSAAAAVEELILDDCSVNKIDDSRGSDSVLEVSILHGDDDMLSQTVGCESKETSSSLVGPAVNSTKCTDRNDSMEFPKDHGNSSVGHSLDEGYSTKDETELSVNGGNVEQGLFVFGECASARHDLSAPEDGICIKLQPLPGSSNRDAPHSRPHEVHETEKASNAAPFNIGSQDDIAKVSFTKSSDGMQTQSTLVAASRLGEYGSFDEKSFILHDHSSAPKDKGVVKTMSMNRRAVKPKKFSSARQVSSLQTVLAADSFSGKVIPESNFNLEQSGKSGLRLEDCGIYVGNSHPEEADATETTEISHHGTRLTFAANSESSGHSDLPFASSTFDHNKLRSQRRLNKKSSEGMPANNSKFVQSLPTSVTSLAHGEVSARQPNAGLAAQWTEYSKAEPTTVTCTRKENFGYQEDCETWRIRGNQSYAAGQLTKAEEYYTHGINSVSPNDASRKELMLCYSNRAATRISLGRMRDALSDCLKATEIDSSFLKAQVRAANCLLALGDIEEARKGFEMCLKSNDAASLNHKLIEEASDGLQKAQKVSSFILQSKKYLVKKEFDKIPSALQMITDALSISIHSDSLMKMKAEALLLLRRYEEVIRFCGETMHLAERNSVSMCLDEHPENINLDSYSSSVKSWRYYLITKSYFFMGKLEEAHQFLKKHEDTTLVEYKCGEQSQQSVSSLSKTISELLHLKVAGNEAFQAGKYSEAVEHYTAALLSNTESLHFSAICFGNRAAAYQAMGHILDAIADCSLAIALDTSYCKVISRRASLYELIRDYSQAENDLRTLISLLEEQLQENMSTPSEKLDNVRNNLHRANLRLSALERDARKRNSLDIYLILGIEPSCSAADIKKAYRKAALRHHPDKVLHSLHLGIFLNSSVR
uniref:Uncharacterized protein n=1 Tax=Avena sativa TaxID=4498 RepID=A0ACD5VW88_AVESA